MHQTLASALLGAALLAGPALAQPYAPPPPPAAEAGRASVVIGPELQAKAARIHIGRRDLDDLQRDLGREVDRALGRAGPGAPVRVDLVLRDAVNNRPTFDQMGRQVSLTLTSRGVGGASVGGEAVFADGRRVPVDYAWYETDLRNDTSLTTWGDANRAFQQLGSRLAAGDLRPSRVGGTSRNAGDFGDPYNRP